MRKKTEIIVITVVVIILGINLYNSYNSYRDKNELKLDTISYLEDKGYDYKTDIEEIQIVSFSLKNDIYAAVVIFKDEPLVNYFYSYKKNSKEIYQVDVKTRGISQTKHKER